MNKNKVIEQMTQHVVTDFLKKVMQSALEKKVLYATYPVRKEQVLAMIKEPGKLADFSRSLN
ncbi:MAG: hypothetical protein ABIJ26_06830 [Candidatus Margulisiibacteriota bacterium]|nr:hypothetical protein [Candidatus Margulisiibacteriota bacterium]